MRANGGVDLRAHPEDGLHLRQVGPRVRSRKHFNDETTERPNVRLAGVGSLFDDFWRHPIHRALQRRSIRFGAAEQVCRERALLSHDRHCSPTAFNSLSSTRFEMPKSEILMPPLLSTRMLAPLMSRCTISRSCR